MLNQQAARAEGATLLVDVKILQVAVVSNAPVGTVENPMHQPNRLLFPHSQRAKGRLGRIQHAAKTLACHFFRKARLVERLIALPKR